MTRKKNIFKLLLVQVLVTVVFFGCKETPVHPNNEAHSLNGLESGKKPGTTPLATRPVTQSFIEGPTASTVAGRLVQSTHNDMQPTGFYLPPNTSFTVTVSQTAGSRLPKLALGTPFRDNVRPVRSYYTLAAGSNTFTSDSYGGLVYILYTTTSTPTSSASVTFGTGFLPVPYYKKGSTTQAQWHAMLDGITNVPDVMLETDRAIIVATREDAITYKNEDQASMVAKIDQIVDSQDAISGIDGSSALHTKGPYKYLITVRDPANSGDYMAAGIAIFYIRSLTYRILQPAHVGGVYGWGLWHEIGHIHQQGPWKWNGLGEVTVNIYSLAAERSFGVTPSRLNRDGIWNDVDTYMALPIADRDFNTAANGIRTRLGMFHQLWMQYGDSFYIDLHKQTRTTPPTVSTDAEKMRYFMLKACTISGNDLTDFFRKWGFKVSETVYAEIAALGLPAPATDLTTLRD